MKFLSASIFFTSSKARIWKIHIAQFTIFHFNDLMINPMTQKPLFNDSTTYRATRLRSDCRLKCQGNISRLTKLSRIVQVRNKRASLAALTTCTIFSMPGNVLAYDGSNRTLGWVVVVVVVTVVVVVCCPGKPWSIVSAYCKTVTQRHIMTRIYLACFANRRRLIRARTTAIFRKNATQVERSAARGGWYGMDMGRNNEPVAFVKLALVRSAFRSNSCLRARKRSSRATILFGKLYKCVL